LLAAMAGCTADDIVQTGGTLPDETPMNTWNGQLCSGRTLSHKIAVNMYEDDEPSIEEISYTLTQPAASAITLKVIADKALADDYNKHYKLESKIFPTSNITLENNGSLTVPAGKKKSENIKLTLSSEGLQSETLYILAVTLIQPPTEIKAQAEKQVLYYHIVFREKTTTCTPEYSEIPIPDLFPHLISVFYVNTETYQPLVAAGWGVLVDFWEYFSLGHIVNLKRATIDYDATSQRALLKPGDDLSYVLEHRDKYIRHLQEYKRQVCLCIENGGKGIGFCNMNDTQIADFVHQVKNIVERYHLDGVNLWDEDSKYPKSGIPKSTTVSYPQLIKALKEAMPDKLLTLVDKGDATEYFYDIDKCGGIEVGKYLDYAWHGYSSPTQELQIINPDMENDTQDYSQYLRKPIAGLDESKYGSVNIPLYSDHDSKFRMNMEEKLMGWNMDGKKKNNIIVYGGDLIGQEYGGYEGAVNAILDSSLSPFIEHSAYFDDSGSFYFGGKLNNYLSFGPDHNPYRKDW